MWLLIASIKTKRDECQYFQPLLTVPEIGAFSQPYLLIKIFAQAPSRYLSTSPRYDLCDLGAALIKEDAPRANRG